MPINLEYPGGECPCCHEPIPDEAESGASCEGCDYEFDGKESKIDILRAQWLNGNCKDVVNTLLTCKRSFLAEFVVELTESDIRPDLLIEMLQNRE